MNLEKLAIIMKEGFDKVDERFDAVDARFEKIDARFDAVDARFDAVEQSIRDLRTEIRAEINDIVNRIDALQHVTGYAKEIDFLMERVTNIEQRLDMHPA